MIIPIPDNTEALVFDCDGTLVDSMPIHVECWHATLAKYGVDLPATYIDDHAGIPTHAIVEQINVDFSVALDPTEVTDEKEAGYVARLDEVQPIKQVVDTARHYYGRLPMAVASGSIRDLVVRAIKSIGGCDWFPVVVTADDPLPGKPAPDVFLEAARQLGVDSRKCHVFEDGDHGITAARAAGMTWTDVRQLG